MKTREWWKAALAFALLLPAGCVQQYMANQPKYKPLQASNFFTDGRASRTPVDGTVSRNYRDDPHLMRGLDPAAVGPVGLGENTPKALAAGAVGGGPVAFLVALTEAQPAPMDAPPATPNKENGEKFVARFAKDFPMPVTKDMLERGQQRYGVFCAVCHGYAGSGDGMIVRRGFTRPPSLVDDATYDPKVDKVDNNYSRGIAYQGLAKRVPDAPVGYYFHVISNGYGAMPEHGTQIPVEDRWAIASYLRVLQKSQRFPVGEATDAIKKGLADSEKAAKKDGGHP